MVYIRTKKIKNNHYAYLVQNKWKKTTAKQTVKQYLGRVHNFSQKHEVEFLDFTQKDEYTSRKDIVKELLKWELSLKGFKQNNKILSNENIKLNLQTLDFDFKNSNKGVIKLNEGYLCSYTLNKLLNFKLTGNKDDFKLARCFVDVGLRIPQELFVAYWQNIIK